MESEHLIKENTGRLTSAARKLSRNFGVPDMVDDLIQEGLLALMEAAKRIDPSGEASFDAHSDRIVKSVMLDYIYRNATPFTMPPDRFRVLRRIARLLADGNDVQEIQGELNVSSAVARKLIMDYREAFSTVPLDNADADVSAYGNPEQIYTEKLLRTSVREALGSLPSRSRTVIKFHLGIDQPDEQPMTFQNLAVRLNYNSPSSSEKAYKRAVSELKRHLDGGEYELWNKANRMIHKAVTKDVVCNSPHIPWVEVKNLSERFIAHVDALCHVCKIFLDTTDSESSKAAHAAEGNTI